MEAKWRQEWSTKNGAKVEQKWSKNEAKSWPEERKKPEKRARVAGQVSKKNGPETAERGPKKWLLQIGNRETRGFGFWAIFGQKF